MNTLNVERHPQVAERVVAYRTRGRAHGPVTRLMSPGDLGEILKPFVFLDGIDIADPSSRKAEDFGLHPHSGIATKSPLNAPAPINFAFEEGEKSIGFARI